MPLRQRSDLWHSMSGIVAAYQPVAAPGPLLARYNMAHGGDNRFSAVVTSWSRGNGWIGATINGLAIGAGVPRTVISRQIIRANYSDLISGPTTNQFRVTSRDPGLIQYYVGGTAANGNVPFAAPNHCIVALSWPDETAYLNGLAVASAWTVNLAGSIEPLATGNQHYVYTLAVYARSLSPAEVWQASRQMAYCDVNPDWSVWGRRRQWFYGPQVGGFQAAWARGSNVVLRGRP